jgi:hypothetical protein
VRGEDARQQAQVNAQVFYLSKISSKLGDILVVLVIIAITTGATALLLWAGFGR